MDIHVNRALAVEIRLGFETLVRAQGITRQSPAFCALWDVGLIDWLTIAEYHINVDEQTVGLAWCAVLELRTLYQTNLIAYELKIKDTHL